MWQKKLEGCFGAVDKKFGQHHLDEQRAKDLKNELDAQGVKWTDVEKEIKKILHGCTPSHIQEQLREAKRLLTFGEERS